MRLKCKKCQVPVLTQLQKSRIFFREIFRNYEEFVIVGMLLKRGTGNGERGTGNGERGTGSGELGVGSGEWGMGMGSGEWGMGMGNGKLKNGKIKKIK